MTEQAKVAIIGGGCAAVATAFELTRAEHQGRFDVTIYQQGWRLGGKGASGRRAPTGRIEEHGLHLWMGFYENAFGMMRECYEELGRDPAACPIATWEDAFKPDNHVGVTEMTGGAWRNWTARFPPAAGLPGDPLKSADPFSIPAYLARCVLLLRTLVTSVQDRLPADGASGGEGLIQAVTALARSTVSGVAADPAGAVKRAAAYGQLTLGVAIAEALDILGRILRKGGGAWRSDEATTLLASLSRIAHGQVADLANRDQEVRRVWEIADIVLAIIRGILRDGLIFNPAGFDAIDEMDWRDWLRKHGASEAALDAAFIRGSYDLLFAFEDGDLNKPRMAAGQALRGALRMFFTYRGALFWKMQAGMGDIVFAPFYEVLERRGVKFEFFHRLENIELSDDKSHVARMNFSVQALTRDGAPYKPLVDVKGVPSWPAEPDFTQLRRSRAIRGADWNAESRWDDRRVGEKTLEVTKDFDFTVLAVGLGEVPLVAPDLVAANPAWRRMIEEVGTVATQAFQVWMKEPVEALGWDKPPINISGYVEPFDTWADMRQLIEREDFKDDPKAVAYFCSVLPSADFPSEGDPREAASKRVRDNAVNFLNRDAGHFWPGAVQSGTFRWD
ncbi:MAG: NAD(P)-binding protein, partial [Pseudomonadota bacterium]